MTSGTAVWSDNIADVLDTTSVQCADDVGGAAGRCYDDCKLPTRR